MSQPGAMPLEIIVIGFVAVAFLAIVLRFLPRDETGARRLPRVVDESVGMYFIRSALRRPTEPTMDPIPAAPSPPAADLLQAADPQDEFSEDEIAYRIGVPGAPPPTLPTRFVVSKARPQAHQIPPVAPVVMRPVVGGRPQARKSGAMPLQRRIAG
ncbi:MAG: hypothetical protein ACJ767_12445, partial [Chloroflexota bacterium]